METNKHSYSYTSPLCSATFFFFFVCSAREKQRKSPRAACDAWSVFAERQHLFTVRTSIFASFIVTIETDLILLLFRHVVRCIF